MKQLPFRQVHLDFHTSEQIADIGAAFDPAEFARTLKNAHVNSVSLFAKCHHGMQYYDSKINPERVHPHLVNKNLLKEQIQACRALGIRTPIYTTVQWDYYTATRHREWVALDGEGRAIGEAGTSPQLPFEAGFYHTLCVNTPYRAFVMAHVRELMQEFAPVDGLFLDIVFPVPCACEACKRDMLAQGYDPLSIDHRARFAQTMIDGFQEQMSALIRAINPDTCIFYNRGHIGTPHRKSKDTYSHFELESLPSGLWGYLHFPCTVRYARTLGKEYLSHTGKFHTMWGDFHSYKNRAALEFECFHMLAQGAKCLIGDQLDPCGQLSPAVYELIGSVYEQVEQKEPWCDQISPVVEIGVFTPEEFVGAWGGSLPEALQGAVRMLQELALQFDVIDSFGDFDKYKLLILPDDIPVSTVFAHKLQAYLDGGGKMIATCKSGLRPAQDGFALDLGVEMRQTQPTDLYANSVVLQKNDKGDYCQYILPRGDLAKGLHETLYVMYIRGLAVEATAGATVLCDNYASVFDRDYRHFCSHRQSPASQNVDHPGVVQKGNSLYFANPIFTQYQHKAPLWCKKLLKNAIDLMLEEKIITHDGPSTLLVTVNDQAQHNRRVVHALHYIPERRCATIDVIEDVIPLYNTQFDVQTQGFVRRVTRQPQNIPVQFSQSGNRVRFILPLLTGHQIIEICAAPSVNENLQ